MKHQPKHFLSPCGEPTHSTNRPSGCVAGVPTQEGRSLLRPRYFPPRHSTDRTLFRSCQTSVIHRMDCMDVYVCMSGAEEYLCMGCVLGCYIICNTAQACTSARYHPAMHHHPSRVPSNTDTHLISSSHRFAHLLYHYTRPSHVAHASTLLPLPPTHPSLPNSFHRSIKPPQLIKPPQSFPSIYF